MTDINASFLMLVLATAIHMVEMNLEWQDVDRLGGYSEAAYTSLATKDEVYDGSASGETIGVLLDAPVMYGWSATWILINLYFAIRMFRVKDQEVKLIRSVGLTKTGDESFDYDSNVTDVHNMLEEAKKAADCAETNKLSLSRKAKAQQAEEPDDWSPGTDDAMAVHSNPISEE